MQVQRMSVQEYTMIADNGCAVHKNRLSHEWTFQLVAHLNGSHAAILPKLMSLFFTWTDNNRALFSIFNGESEWNDWCSFRVRSWHIMMNQFRTHSNGTRNALMMPTTSSNTNTRWKHTHTHSGVIYRVRFPKKWHVSFTFDLFPFLSAI